MTPRLRIPTTLAVVVLAGCDGSAKPKADAHVADAKLPDASQCVASCVHDTAGQEPCGCIAPGQSCASGCYACELYCIGTSADAGTCPMCATPEGNCPTGCEPIG
jgi:hypothetical protein|nr:hypothetical protein [Kofleriaceae bacterium]